MTKPGARGRGATVVLLLAILVLGLLVVSQQRREARLRAALAQFQSQAHQNIHNHLNNPLPWRGSTKAIPLNWGGRDSLGAIVGQLAGFTGRPRFARLSLGLPVEVDPTGLEEAGQSLQSIVQLPPAPKGDLSLQELLMQILDPNALAWHVKDGTLLITSRKALDRLNERILKRLEQPVILKWSKGDSLEDVIERVRVSTEGLSFPDGLPIFLQVRGSDSREHFPLPDPVGNDLPIGEQLRRILEPLGLRYEVKDGAVMIVTENVADESG